MRLSLQSTERVVEVNGVPARVWQGHTADGTEVTALITRLAVRVEADQAAFEAELVATGHVEANRDAVQAWPNRLVL